MAESPRNRDMQAPAGQPDEPVPPPDKVPGAPDTPLDLGGTGWKYTLKRAAKEYVADRCSMTAGSWPTTGSWRCSRPLSPCSAWPS